jgi:hypothetical protein
MLTNLVNFIILLGLIAGSFAVGAGEINRPLDPSRLGINDLKLFIQSQQLHRQVKLNLYPAKANWSALAPEIQINKQLETEGFPIDGSYTVVHGANLPSHRVCVRFGAYTLVRPLNEEGCLGDWLQNRADSRSTAMSMFRLNWTQAPTKVQEIPLQIRQGMTSGHIDTETLPIHGLTAFVLNGNVIEAYSALGHFLWRSDSVGIGDIIDISDLDNDGDPEVIFSARSGFSASAPAKMVVLSATTGKILWTYQFEGLEFGIDRYRTTILELDGSGAKSILATLTYSPSLFRFDFSGGVRNGFLAWKSEEFIYDSPDKSPLVGDFDQDGRLEIIVDSRGTLYSLDAVDGKIKAKHEYGEAPSFQGFLSSRLAGNGNKIAITSASDSEYYKGFVTVHSDRAGLVRAAGTQWEVGIQNTKINVEFLKAPLEVLERLGGLVPVTINDGTGDVLHLLDLNTNTYVWSLPGYRALYPMTGPGTMQAIAVQGPQGAAILSLDASEPVRLMSFPGSTFQGTKSIRHCTPGKRLLCGQGGAIRKDNYDRLYIDMLDASGEIVTYPIRGPDLLDTSSIVSVTFSGGLPLLSDGRTLYQVDLMGNATAWLKYSPKVFITPLVADLEGYGVREIVVPYGQGISRLRVDSKGISAKTIFDKVPLQFAESFYIPVILNINKSTERRIVSFISVPYSVGRSRINVSARSARNEHSWVAKFDQNSWERSLLGMPGGSTGNNVALRHSRGTILMDGASGVIIWSNEEVGECQRQMASADWNKDGVGDLILQTGPTSWVLDGVSGTILYSKYLRTAYGSYSAVGGSFKKGFSLVHSGSGALAIANQAGEAVDQQIDQRRIEPLPVVIGKQSRMGDDRIFKVNGSGEVSVYDLSGQLLQLAKFQVPVVSMTGAFVDRDDSIDLLLSTSDGKLLAISGKDLREIWSAQLNGALGTPVATTLNGLESVIVVASSTGSLYVLRE